MNAFAEEFEKIAGVGSWLKDTARWGFHGGDPSNVGQAKGRFGRAVNKGFMFLGPAMVAAETLPKNDPLGRGRSRAERAVGGAADIAGGALGAGALLKTRFGRAGGWKGFAASTAGGLIGGSVARRVATGPWAAARRRSMANAQQAQQAQAPQAQPPPQEVPR